MELTPEYMLQLWNQGELYVENDGPYFTEAVQALSGEPMHKMYSGARNRNGQVTATFDTAEAVTLPASYIYAVLKRPNEAGMVAGLCDAIALNKRYIKTLLG